MINGDKSQDIGDAEKRSLIEIKEAIVRVQTAPAMDIIAEKDLTDKNIQARLGVEIEKFDPNAPILSEKVKERIDELKAEGKEIVAFYDKVTKKIFINQNAKDEEVRASIAREYKIKEDLKLGRGKENDKGQLRSTVAGEIAYDEIKDRLNKGDKNPISASSFDVAKMDKDSEITADNYRPEDRKLRKEYKEIVYFTDERMEQMSEGGVDMMAGGGTALAGGAVIGASVGADYVTFGTTMVPSIAAKAAGGTAVVVGGNRFITGTLKFINGLYGSGKKKTLNPIRDSIPKKYQGYYDAFEVTAEVGILHLAPYAQPYYSQPNKSVINISQQQRELNKQMNLNASVGQQKVPIFSTRRLTGGKNYNVIKETSQGNVFINNGKPGGTTKAYQKRITYPDGSMSISQKNLTTGKISLQKINPLGQRISETSFTPYPANALIGANSSSKMLVGNGVVSKVGQVGQVQNNKLPYKSVHALPNYLSKPEQGGVMVVGAGTKAISGAYNIDINPKVGGVHYGDATNLVNVPTGSQSKVIIENPFRFNPYNSEILRVLQKGGELKVTGVESNKYFNSIIEDIDKKIIKVPEGYELIEVKEIPILERKQGFQSSGRPIGKKTDIEIRLRKK